MSTDRLPWVWGVTAAEWSRETAADRLASPGSVRLMRGVSCTAPPGQVWPWLCQLRVAPYSYDLLDNRGRRSPRQLTPGLTDIAVGDGIAPVFVVVDVDAGRGFTFTPRPTGAGRLMRGLLMTYDVVPTDSGCRLLGTLRWPAHHGVGRLADQALAWGDLVMMRHQLRNLAGLSSQ